MPRVHTSSRPDVIIPAALTSVDERERRLIEAVVALARSLRDERDRLAKRLHEVERELSLLASRLDDDGVRPGGPVSPAGTAARAARPPRPSRTPE